MTERIRGVYCAAATPLLSDGAPDFTRIAAHARQLITDGCNGIALLGTTGEANSFSVGERQQILEAAITAVSPGELLPGTGVCAIPDTVALTKHALSLGVTKVLMLPPFYYKAPSDDGLFAAYSEVIDKVADSRLRVLLYHIPKMSMVPLGLPLIERLVKRYPQTVVGLKDSSGEYAYAESLVRNLPGFSVFVGTDPQMRDLLAIGGAGCITGAANLVASDLAIVFRHHADPARQADIDAAQQRIIRARTLANTFVAIPAIKAMLARRYRDDAWLRVRPPLMAMTAGQLAELDRLMLEPA